MKSNWIKYVFIIFVILILIFASYIIKKDEAEKKQGQQQTTTTQENQVKEIKVGIAELDTMNPILSKNKNVQTVTKLIYEPLVNLTSDYKAEPCLAKEWAKQSDNSYLIKLRENVRWSDGQSFTADDVKFTIDRLKDSNTIYSSNVKDVTSIDVEDDYTVRINLDKDKKEKIKKIGWNIQNIENIIPNTNVILIGSKKFINEKVFELKERQVENLEIIACYNYNEVKNDMKEIVSKYDGMLNTLGINKI